jgi:hypothetical protein
MSTRGKGLAVKFREFFTGIDANLPFLSAEEQTKLSWARAIKSLDEIPESYRSSFKTISGNETSFPYSVLIPSSAGFFIRSEEKLVFCMDNNIYVLEGAGNDLTTTCYPVEKISYIQAGVALLQSWIKIRGTTSSGVIASTEFTYNTVTEHLLRPIVEQARPMTDSTEDIDQSRERSKFNFLKQLNYKLMNYGKRSLLPGEEVIQVILQPEIRAEMLKLLGISFFKTLCPSHIIILSHKELIMIQDGTGDRWGRSIRHGGIWNYIPLTGIASISTQGTQNDLLTLSIHLPGDEGIDSIYSISNRQQVEILLRRVEAIQKG